MTAEEIKQQLIKKHLTGWTGLESASINHYAETGKISGSLSIAIHKMLDEYASQQRTEGIKEGFDAARERRYLSPYNKYNTVEDYLNSK